MGECLKNLKKLIAIYKEYIIQLRFCMSNPHSGCPFQYDVLETTTIGEICNMVLATNNHWWDTGIPVSSRWSVVRICGPNNTFLENTRPIGGGHYQNECVLVFDAA